MSLYTIGGVVLVSGVAGFLCYWVECRREIKRNQGASQHQAAKFIVE